MWNRSTGCPTHCFSLVVCRQHSPQLTASPQEAKKTGNDSMDRWLAVSETKRRGWWLPGGFVEPNDFSHTRAAIRETLEEAGIDVVLKGILRVEHSMKSYGARQRVIFYAEPKDPQQVPKQIPDKESLKADWLTLDELKEKSNLPPPEGLRGTELLDWATYISNGGTIFPLDLFVPEETPIPLNSKGSTS